MKPIEDRNIEIRVVVLERTRGDVLEVPGNRESVIIRAQDLVRKAIEDLVSPDSRNCSVVIGAK